MKNKSIILIVSGVAIALGGLAIGISNYSSQKKVNRELRSEIDEMKRNEALKEETQNAKKEETKPVVATTEEKDDDIKETENSIYKSDVSEKQIEILEEKYNKKTQEFFTLYGSAFREYGGPIYSEGEEGLRSAKEFYGRTDKILNDLWKDLNIVLRPDIYKNLQKEQVEWIKERDIKASKVGAVGTISYIDEQGRETYQRVRYLVDTYLD
ncbi:MAG: lysozyme inhibitor LprI family protein [Clostridium sp.]